MKLKAEKLTGKDLKPGDLFSSAGDDYWKHTDPLSIGQRVYIRTDTPLAATLQAETVYRITIDMEETKSKD